MTAQKIASANPAGIGIDTRSSSWVRILVALLFALWVPATLYLLLFAPMPLVHDTIHPVRHAFSMIMCH
ncbi:MAG: CbtB-domain containing protein [Nitrospirae bacterium]|nr:CbtB-domain containing protein [Nitrospirota bacterium]